MPLRYGLILADPAWEFLTYSEKGLEKSAQAHYECHNVHDMARLLPVHQLAADDCVLVMWATAPMINEALWLMRAWGFTYKTMGAWGKQSSTGRKIAFGPGYILRSAAEFYLIGTYGKPKVRSRSIRNLILAPVRGHSRKPDQLHQDLERLYDGPYVELFARQRRPGWDSWGNQVDKFGESAT